MTPTRKGANIPETLGPYRIVRLIARGGMGEVYEAEQATPVQRRVAIKVIRAGMDTEDVLSRFSAERKALALMAHPHIAAIHDAGATAGGSPYVVMEYVDGMPLTEYVTEKHLDLGSRLDLFLQVCAAVSHAHQKGIIHRDLKPNNILVTELDGKAVPKVIDFGIAKMIEQPLTKRTLQTSLGELIGTPEYMSPEQAAGTGLDVDTRADVYSLGVILYELLSGEHPLPLEILKGSGLEEMLRSIRANEPARPSTMGKRPGKAQNLSLSRELAGDLDWITLRALEKDRERRYDSVLDLAEDIQRHRRHEPVMAGPPSHLYRVKKFARRNRLAVSFGSVMAAMLLASILAVTWQWRSAVSERHIAEIERHRAEVAGEQALQEADRAQRINTFLQDMLSAADPSEMGKDVMVRQVLDQAAATLDTELATEPESRADAHHTLGVTYTSLSLLEEGRGHLEQALTLKRELHGPDHESIVAEILALSDSLYKLGEGGEARLLTLEGLRMQRRLVAEPDVLIGKLLGKLAEAELRLGFVVDAERLAHAAVDQLEALAPDHERVLGEMLVTLAEVFTVRGDALSGEAVVRRALEIHVRLLGENHPTTLRSMSRLAIVLMKLGPEKNDEIEALHTDVLERSRRTLGEDHLQVARALNDLAMFLTVRRGRVMKARRIELEALRIWRLNYEANHYNFVLGLINLGYFASESGDLAQAKEYFREAVDVGTQVDAELVTMIARVNLARAMHHGGELEDALPLWDVASDYRETRLDPESAMYNSYLLDESCLYAHLGRLGEVEILLKKSGEILGRSSSVGDDFEGGRWYQQHLLGQLRARQGRWPEAEILLEDSLGRLRQQHSWFSVRRHTFREAEKICRQAGRTQLADAHAEALVELEASLKPALSEAPAPAGSP